jgi:HTH-type transcriptional regulator / antitoxin HigA
VVSNIDLEALAPAWRSFQNRAPVKFCTIKTRRHYRAMVDFLDELVDEIGDRESHALVGLLDIVSLFVHDYEGRDSEFPNSKPHAALRFFMEQHNLRQSDLANIFGSHSNVRDVLNGKREIDTSRARTLASRFHVSAAVFMRNSEHPLRRSPHRTKPTARKRTPRIRASTKTESVVVYRGIKIPPISGKRSPTAEALRDALRARYGKMRDESG